MRIFAVSDIHTDYKDNLSWVQNLSSEEYSNDAILIAGDVSDRCDELVSTLRLFTERFKYVFFTPGNHDLWIRRDSNSNVLASKNIFDSLDKLDWLFRQCDELGVHIRPKRLAWSTENVDISNHGDEVSPSSYIWIVPLLSWHHRSFDNESDITYVRIPSVDQMVMDYKHCEWPEDIVGCNNDSIAIFMDELNDRRTRMKHDDHDFHSWSDITNSKDPVISFSHFLPRVELIPEKRYLIYPNLPKAVGSTFLFNRLQSLKPQMHVFGHTHFAWDATLEGIRYVQVYLYCIYILYCVMYILYCMCIFVNAYLCMHTCTGYHHFISVHEFSPTRAA
jgi:hypothetical protein